MSLTKAHLIELNGQGRTFNGGKDVTVQFNPDSLKLQLQNSLQTPPGAATSGSTNGPRLVGAGVSKLALQLWFDAGSPTANGQGVDDVRRLTSEIAYFITPQTVDNQQTAPGVRFSWGTFKFDGLMESFDENIEYFSPDGKPLRASVSFTLTAQRIATVSEFRGDAARALNVAVAPPNGTVQQMAAANGRPETWRDLARANGIEDPLRLPAGARINTSPPRRPF